MLTILRQHLFRSVLWTLSWQSLLPLCINHSEHLYYTIIQNLVYNYRNFHLTCHIQHAQEFSKMIILPLKSSQSDPYRMAPIFKQKKLVCVCGICLHWTLSPHWTILQYASPSKTQTSLVHRYECYYYIKRWLRTIKVFYDAYYIHSIYILYIYIYVCMLTL